MKTLVIHPKDITTDFLSDIYSDKDWTVININVSKSFLKKQIKEHDRIVMLGHGTGDGLIGFKRLIIDSNYVYLLRDKITVCIWCNADNFVKKYDLKGFYTGMIISEMDEANLYSLYETSQANITASNILFATAIKNAIDSDDMLSVVQQKYKKDDNNIVNFNKERIWQRI